MTADVSIRDVTSQKEGGLLHFILGSQAFWVTVAVVVICVVMSFVSDAFATRNNFFNVTRNFAFIGIIALGMTAVIITAGIDLSVGSVMGLTGIVTGLILNAGFPLYVGVSAGLATALAAGAIAPDEGVVLFNTGAAQKYVEVMATELPRLETGRPIDWDRILEAEAAHRAH